MAPQPKAKGKGDLFIKGAPHTPLWTCPACKRTRNWACRAMCFCKEPAPKKVVDAAKKAAAEAKAKKEADVLPCPTVSSSEAAKAARLEKEANQLRQEVRELKAAAKAPAAEGNAEAAAPDDGTASLLKQIEACEYAVKALEGCYDKEHQYVKDARQRVLDLRKQRDAAKGPVAQHERVQRQLAAAKKRGEGIDKEIEQHEETIAAAWEDWGDAKSRRAVNAAEILALEKEYLRTASAVAPKADPVRECMDLCNQLDRASLASNPEIATFMAGFSTFVNNVQQVLAVQQARTAQPMDTTGGATATA